MNYALVLSALEKHARMAQAAVTFARDKGRGTLFTQAMQVLTEAETALAHVRREQAKSNPPPTRAGGAPVPPSRAAG